MVISTLNIKSVQPKRLHKKVRRLNTVTTEQLGKEFNPANISLTSNLEANVESLSKEFRRVLDALARIKNHSVSLKLKKPWFNKELVAEKAKVRCHEKKWLKYRLPSSWTAYKKLGIHTMPNSTIARRPAYTENYRLFK